MYLSLISFLNPYRQTPRSFTLHTSSSSHAAYSNQISAWIPIQSKVPLIPSNSADYLLPDLKCSPNHWYFGYTLHTPLHTSAWNII